MRRLVFALAALSLLAAGVPGTPAGAATAGTPPIARPSVMQSDDARHQGDALTFTPSTGVVEPRAATTPGASAPSNPAPGPRSAAPRSTVVYNGGGLYREVFGFAPYWALGTASPLSNPNNTLSDLQYDKVSTLAYFGLTINSNGTLASDSGMTGWNSQQLTDLLNNAHSRGDRVVVVAKDFNDSNIYPVVHNQATGDAAIANIVAAARARGVDGINVDFEGTIDNTNYPNISSDFTAWVGRLSQAMRSQWAGSSLTLDAYAGAASSTVSFMRIDTLAPYVDAFFIMGYDYNVGTTLPNAPLTGYSFDDTNAVDQFLSRVGGDGSKVILGVPYYGYKFSTQNGTFHAPLNGNCVSGSLVCSDTYDDVISDLTCGAQQLSINGDSNSATPWASWYSPATGDPCGGNHNSWRELYYDNTTSIGAKYDLVNNRNIRGAGIWAMGNDHGSGDLWSVIKNRFQVCPPATVASTAGPIAGGIAPKDQALWITRGSGFDCLGGVISAAPAVGSLPRTTGGHLPFFLVTAPNHDLWVRTGNSGWEQLDSSGVYCIDSPAVAVSGLASSLTVHIACQGSDHAVWYATANPADGAVPHTQHGAWHSMGGTVSAGPGLDIQYGQPAFYGEAGDGRIWTSTPSVGGWFPTSWMCSGHPAVSDTYGTSNSTFACRGRGDGALWYATNNGSGWTNAASAGGRLVDGPGVAAGPGVAIFYVTGVDGAVYDRTLGGGGLSPGWNNDGGQVSTGMGATYN